MKATTFISRTQLAAGTRIMLSGENVFLDKNPGWNSAAGDLLWGQEEFVSPGCTSPRVSQGRRNE